MSSMITFQMTGLSDLDKAMKKVQLMRKALSNAVKQALYRYQEKVLAGRTKVLSHIVEILGVEDGYRVIDLLRSQKFDDGVIVELTASSASTNKRFLK